MSDRPERDRPERDPSARDPSERDPSEHDGVVGPFRTAAPTKEARLAKERDASLDRVERLTRVAIEEELRVERRWDRLAWLGLALASLACAVVGVLLTLPVKVGAPALVCPASALFTCAVIGVLYRRRLARHPSR